MGELFQDIKYYIDLRVKALKLSTIKHASVISSRIISIMAIIVSFTLAIMLFTGALTVLIYHWIGSLVWAFVIMGAFFVILATVLFLVRDRLFTGALISTLTKQFFGQKSKYDDDYRKEYDYER